MNCVGGLVVESGRSAAIQAQHRPLPVAGLALAFAIAQVVSPVAAQQNAPQPTPPAAPQPGAGAQLKTGTSSGLSLDVRMQNLLADHQYFRVAAQLDQLAPGQAQFYRGILANRSNDLKQSVQLLEPLVDQVTASGDTAHEKLLREALAEDYLRLGDYAKAAQAYQTLDARLHAKLSPGEQDDIEMPLKMLPLAKDNPPTTVEPCDPFTLQVSTDPLGLVDIPVFVDARSRSWMLDPTAPFNLIARSTAKEAGLKISDATATIHMLTGRSIQVHVTVIPRFTIGGRLTLRDMTAFVYDDADYSFPRSGYQVEGVLGYPALAAIGSLTVAADDTIQIRPAKPVDPAAKIDLLTTGAPFFLDGDQVIVALGRARSPSANSAAADPAATADSAAGPGSQDEEDDRMYAIDAGGQQTYLTSRYFDEHTAEFNTLKEDLFSFPGMQSAAQPAYVAETVPLMAGNTTIDFHYIRVLTQPLGSAALDDVYGVLGVDALGQLKSYTFDYRTMRFSAESE